MLVNCLKYKKVVVMSSNMHTNMDELKVLILATGFFWVHI